MIQISPSILSANFAALGEDIKKLDVCGADMIHIDVMDGNFVPNITFGVPIIKSIRGLTKLPFDLHLMIDEPSKYIEDFARAGADIISFHYEAEKHIDRTVRYIKSLGLKASIALNPGTPISVLSDILPELNMVLIMTVNPGFGGQSFISYSNDKVKELKKLASEKNKDLLIEVDGGINKDTISLVVENGADVVVAGSAIFNDGKVKENMESLRRGC